jgi:threonine 3-dehydrogenase
MKALVKARDEPGLWMSDMPQPRPGAHEVLVRIEKAAICGTDMHIWDWDEWARQSVPVPLIVGHEFVGTVVETGAEVADVTVGQRISGEGHIPCGHCRNCLSGRAHICAHTKSIGINRPGAFAEYLVIPQANARPVPDDLAHDVAAILDPLGNAVHTALAFDVTGEDVLITGAGPIGCMATAICRHVGAHHVVVTDLVDQRLELALRMGATRALRADRVDLRQVMADLGMREGFDIGLEMSGSAAALGAMTEVMITGGSLALLGLYPSKPVVDLNCAIFKGLTLKGIYGRKMFETWHKMLAMLESGLDVSPVISHRFPFAQFERGFEVIRNGEANKVILDVAD